jgi:hypothetical protein
MHIRPKYFFSFMDRTHSSLGIFSTDSGITLSFGPNTYFIDAADPFHNIACKALELEDYIPLYVEIAKREGVGSEFRNMLLDMIAQAKGEDSQFEDLN